MIRKLTADDVKNARELHKFKMNEIKRLNNELGVKSIADKFGVHISTMEKVLSYETWRWVMD